MLAGSIDMDAPGYQVGDTRPPVMSECPLSERRSRAGSMTRFSRPKTGGGVVNGLA